MLTTPITNPLLDFSDLPQFDKIVPADVLPAIQHLLHTTKERIDVLSDSKIPATWDDFAVPLQDELEHLERAWGIAQHLHSVKDVPEWREAYNSMLPEVSAFFAELGQNPAVFEKYKSLAQDDLEAMRDPVKQKVIRDEIRDFRLSGAELPEKDKPRFRAIAKERAKVAAKFSENLLDATNAWQYVVSDEKELAGLPEDVKAAACEAAVDAGVSAGGKIWLFTLHMPSYLPIMQYADHRPLRETAYRAYATRAAEFTDAFYKADWDNRPSIYQDLRLKQEAATYLGFKNSATRSLVTKMAESTDQVFDFLRDLAKKAKPFALQEKAALESFAAENLGIAALEPWDIAYASEKLRKARYDFSEHEVKNYFTEQKVLTGLFDLIDQLFGFVIKPDTAPAWHEDVRFYRVEDKQQRLVGQFYLDLYARPEKRGGAWMDDARGRKRKTDGTLQTPIAYLNCNFSKPVGDKPATFSHDEVCTLFHEMGHGLHHLLTRVEVLAAAGINGVEWDAVELPSQFLENYAWEWAVISEMTAHVDTALPLPRALFDKMYAAKNFHSGLHLLRQIELALFDMRAHTDFDPKTEDIYAVLHAVREEVAVFIPPDWHRFPNSFSHIFGGGYAAGYFSYLWAEVLSADAYAAFEETGNPLDKATGQRFLDHILSVGSTRPAIESFVAFRGRVPQSDALLRHNGMFIKGGQA